MRTRLAAAIACCALLPACASSTLDLEKLSSPSDKIVWEAAQQAIEDHDYESARQYLRRIIDAFPQSQYQEQARITLGDTYLDEGGAGNAILAVSAYREFLTLYPSAPQAAYAQFRAAEAYFSQMNNPDRDQTPTLQALEEYQRLLDVYPNSQYVEPARERIQVCRQTLAQSEFQVGYFYQKTRKAWRAAIGRYERILREYPDYENLDEVMFRLGQGLAATARFGEARPMLVRLEQEFPESKWIPEAQKILAEMPEMAPAAPPVPEAADASTGESTGGDATPDAAEAAPEKPGEAAGTSEVTGPAPQG